jgi:hypothetical protein
LVLDVDLIWPVVFLEEAMSVLVVWFDLSRPELYVEGERRVVVSVPLWDGRALDHSSVICGSTVLIDIESHG